MNQPWYKPAEAAVILQTTPEKINEMARDGRFDPKHVYQLGKEIRISPAAFDAPAQPVVVEDEVTLARVRKHIDLVQQELDLVRKLVERQTPLERMG